MSAFGIILRPEKWAGEVDKKRGNSWSETHQTDLRKNILAAFDSALAAMAGECFLQPSGFLLHLIQ